MMKIICLFCLLAFTGIAAAAELRGKLEASTYTDENGYFTTELPTLDGELKEFPNAVSVFSEQTGAQDSLEFYPLPIEEQDSYIKLGAHDYLTGYVRRELIDGRYRESFAEVKIISEQIESVKGKPFYLTVLELPRGSNIRDAGILPKDMWVAIGTQVQDKKVYIFQVALTKTDEMTATDVALTVISKVLAWAGKTRFRN